MEEAVALLELVDDAVAVSKLDESELLARVESARRHLRFSKLPRTSSAVVACHITTQTVAHLVTRRHLSGKNASSKWRKRVFLLETAVAEAAVNLKNHFSENASGDFQQLLQVLWQSSPAATNATAVMTQFGILLACTWLSYDQVGNLKKTLELLRSCGDFCLRHDSLHQFAKWPLFLLAIVHLVAGNNHQEALKWFKQVQQTATGLSESDGLFHYWHAVALLCNGNATQAASELEKCIRNNYEPVATLSLQAMLQLQSQDVHAAVENLQRALEIDFSDPNSLFNVALLMGRLENFAMQQQLLEYVLQFRQNSGKVVQKEQKVALFDEVQLAHLFPSQRTNVNLSTVTLHLAISAMENASWMESKNYFEEYFDGCQDSQSKAVEAARDYIYVLLQCNLPSLALSRCSQFLSQFEDDHSAHGNAVMVVSMLLLHMYKADSLLCLERVDECHDYLKQIVQPKIQLLLQQSSRSSTGQTSDATFVEVVSCHTQLLNNLAVVTVCCDGIDAAIAILREGLQQYPDCLALKFNLVLLLWRKGDKTVACSMWVEARGWTLTTGPTGVNPLSVVSSYENAAASVSPSETPLISEHVQSDSTGDGNVSEQQLAYLDALILNHWRKIRNAKLEATSLQYVEYFENLGNSHSIQLDVHHN